MTELTYSNPRMSAVIPDWPSGSRRVTARFEIEQSPRGERAVRTTDGAPKKLTFAKMARIVDGIMRGDMKIQHEAIFEHDSRYPMALELFAQEATA